MIDIVRTSLHRALTTPAGDRFFALRVPKDLARRMNVVLGEPLCSKAELDRRRAGRAKLDELARPGHTAARAAATPAEQPPVMIYFEMDRNAQTLGRLREMLDAKAITYTLLDVADDEVTRNFILREAKCKTEDLPVVFVAGSPVGGYDALVEWDASGRLAKALENR